MIDEEKLKDALDQVAYADGNRIIDDITYHKVVSYLPSLAKALYDMPEILQINSTIRFNIA